jgi:S1-C subfamily serine protease
VVLVAAWPLFACAVEDVSLSRLRAAVSAPEGTHAAYTGTAFFVSSEGILLTADHVVPECLRVDILSESMPPTAVTVIARDHRLDLALLRVVGQAPPPPATLAMSVTPGRPSERLRAYGYPRTNLRRATTIEVISANDLVPAESIGRSSRKPGYLLWLDGPVEHGYSGGPVVNQKGEVVGIVSRTLTKYSVAIGTWTMFEFIRKAHFMPRFLVTETVDDQDPSVRAATVRLVCWRDWTSEQSDAK